MGLGHICFSPSHDLLSAPIGALCVALCHNANNMLERTRILSSWFLGTCVCSIMCAKDYFYKTLTVLLVCLFLVFVCLLQKLRDLRELRESPWLALMMLQRFIAGPVMAQGCKKSSWQSLKKTTQKTDLRFSFNICGCSGGGDRQGILIVESRWAVRADRWPALLKHTSLPLPLYFLL